MLKRITYPEVSIGWLGLTKKRFENALYRRGKLPTSYQSRAITNKLIRTCSEEYTCDVSQLSEGLMYPCCVDSEMTFNELRRDELQLRRSYTKWEKLLEGERVRIESFFEKRNPSHVILVQGYEPTNWFAREQAIKRDIPMLALENTALKSKLVWDSCSGIVVNRNSAENYYWRYWDSVTDDEVSTWYRELEETTNQLKSNEHSSPVNAPKTLSDDKPVILFLGQVYTDSSILFGSGEWLSPVDLMVETLTESIKIGAMLVVKLHPKEAVGKAPIVYKSYDKLTYRKMLENSFLKNEIQKGLNILVDHDNRWGTYELMKQAQCAVTMNSQAGLEAQLRGVPAVVCGHSFYGGLGFTYQAPNSYVLAISLKDALNCDDCSEWTYKARKFAYIYFEKYCIEKSEFSVVKKLLSI